MMVAPLTRKERHWPFSPTALCTLTKSFSVAACTATVSWLAIGECSESEAAMLVGHELGYAVDCRPIGSCRATMLKLGSSGSIGHGKVPVDSCRLLKEGPVSCARPSGMLRAPPGSPTDKLCPVPTTPVQS